MFCVSSVIRFTTDRYWFSLVGYLQYPRCSSMFHIYISILRTSYFVPRLQGSISSCFLLRLSGTSQAESSDVIPPDLP